MQVAELWRYPVKSLQGEPLELAAVTTAGLKGDRRFALFDVETGFGLTGRRAPELLFASARLGDDGGVDIALPDGSVTREDDALSAWLGRRVTLRSADAEVPRHYESPVDFENEAMSDWAPWDGAGGAYHDSAERGSRWFRRPQSAHGTGAGSAPTCTSTGRVRMPLWDPKVTLGEATLDVGMRLERCVMTTRPQAGGVERDLDVLRRINRERGGCLAVGALVRKPGTVRVGDTLTSVRGGPRKWRASGG